MSEQTYGYVCDNCENPVYPLMLLVVLMRDGRTWDYWLCQVCYVDFDTEEDWF